jgi:hypothetical protein
MKRNDRDIALSERDDGSGHALTPMNVLRHSGKAVVVGAVTGAVAGALAGAVAGASAWALWVLGRESVKALRDRAGL